MPEEDKENRNIQNIPPENLENPNNQTEPLLQTPPHTPVAVNPMFVQSILSIHSTHQENNSGHMNIR